MNGIRYALRNLFRKNKVEADMAEEMEAHVQNQIQANLASGMDPEEARFAAFRQFGRVETLKESCREQRTGYWIENLFQDLRIAARLLRKSPGFTTVALLSLGLGIGFCTAIFSLVNAILLRSLPVPNPHELRVIHWAGKDARMRSISGHFKTTGDRSVAECFSPILFSHLREKGGNDADIFAFAPIDDAVVRARSDAFSENGLVVSDNFFTGLGVRPHIGTGFQPGDNGATAGRSAVLSFDFWANHFAHDPKAIGQALTLNGHSFTVAGVLPRDFEGVRPGDPRGFYLLYTPESPFFERAVSSSEHWWIRLMARVRSPGNDVRLAASLDQVFAPEAESQMKAPEILIKQGGGGLAFDRDKYGKPLLLMLLVVGLVLLIACANIAGLSLARGAARQHEMAVRAALGAGRWRLIRQSLAESLLLALTGGALGIAFAIWGRKAISQLLSTSAEGLRYDLGLDLTVLSFSLALALATALLSGLLPALRAGSANPLTGLKARAALGVSRLLTGKALVVAQVALSLVLLSGAGLYLRTLANLRQIDAGFDTEKLLIFQLNAGSAGYKDQHLSAFYDRVQTALSGIPGVRAAGLTVFPLLDNKSSSGGFAFPNRSTTSPGDLQTFRLVVGETFFATLGVPILDGRSLSAADSESAPKTVVVNQTFAKKYFPNGNPIGEILRTWSADWQIVGVCGDIKYENIKDAVPPTTYIPFRQFPRRFGAYFVVRTTSPPLALATAAQKAVAAIDPAIPIAHLTTQENLVNAGISQERLFATLCAVLAAFALLLSCIGLYGLMSFNVARRTSEIGIRMAIGAEPGQVARSVVTEAILLAGIGVAAGIPVVLAATRAIQNHLYDVKPHDPAILAIVPLILLLVSLGSAWLPARRAARVSPIIAVRSE
jgi:predicted permease